MNKLINKILENRWSQAGLMFVMATTFGIIALTPGKALAAEPFLLTSNVKDATSAVTFTTLSWTETIPANTGITMEFQAGNTATPDGTWQTWASVTNGGSISAFAGNRYFQYRATHTATDAAAGSATLGIVSANYNTYFSPGTLGGTAANNIGLRADAGANSKAKASSLIWTGTTAYAGQKILFKVRTGDTQAELDANTCYGPTTLDTGCADWTTAGKFFSQINGQSNSGTGIPATIESKRYMEVLVRMESSGADSPTLSDVTLTYDNLESPINANITLKRTDNTSLRTSAGIVAVGGVPDAWSNQPTLRVETSDLTCTGCATAPTNLRPEVEIKPVGSAFTGTTNIYTATAGNAYVDIPNLTPGTGYHLQVRAIDDQGRVSGWTAYGGNTDPNDIDFKIDQTVPSGTFSINAGAQYTTSASVTINSTASDTGGSNLSLIRFSNDGTTWSAWQTYNVNKAWTLASGDGPKPVYAQYMDNAGNVSGWTQTSDSDFNAGLTKTNVTVGSGNITLNATPALPPIVTIGTQVWMQNNLNVGTMITGATAQTNNAVLEKYCYNNLESNCTTHGAFYQWGEAVDYLNGASNATDPNPAFSGNVQGICPIGFHLPSDAEYITLEMYLGMTQAEADATNYRGTTQGDQLKDTGLCSGRTPCGTSGFKNLLSGGKTTAPGSVGHFWSSSNFSWSAAWVRGMDLTNATVRRVSDTKSYGYAVRCLKDNSSSNPYVDSGTFESSIRDAGSTNVAYGNATFSTTVPGGTGLTVSVRGGNTATPDGTWTVYSTIVSGGSVSALNGKQYIQYKVEMTGGAATPTFSDISIESSSTASISVDSQLPTGSLTVGASNPEYVNNKAVTLYLDPTTPEPGGSGIKEFQLSNDGVNWGTAYNPTTATYTSGWQTWSESYRTVGAGFAWNLVKGQSDAGTDGSRTVYVLYRDNAGNINTQTGTPPNYTSGTLGASLTGKYIRNSDLSTTYIWQTSPSSLCSTSTDGTQPCQIGLDPSYPSSPVLVSPQLYPSMSFSTYPAQNACKTEGGRLPNMAELQNIIAYKSTYGGIQSNGSYYSATEYSSYIAWYRNSYTNLANNFTYKIQSPGFYVRCVRDIGISSISDIITLDTYAPTVPANTITSPNGNEKWAGGSSKNITWNKDIIVDNVGGYGLGATPIKLEYTTNGTDYIQIATGEANDGTYTWNSLPTLNNSTVRIRITATDTAGYSSTDVSDADFIIDSTVPTGAVSIGGPNVLGGFARSTDVTLTISGSDTGGSGLGQMQFSNDGVTWSEWEAYSTTKAWTLITGDGSKTVYAQIRDNAGNVSSWVQTSDADFSAGLTKTNVTVGSGAITLAASDTSGLVTIGTQIWMAKNLNVGTMITGATAQTNNAVLEKYCYNDLESNCTTDGGLYQWGETVQYLNGASNTTSPNPAFSDNVQGICPTGFHLPTDAELKTLEMYMGMTQAQADATGWRGTTQGDRLKITGLCQGRTPCGTSGFSGLLPGYVYGGTFNNQGSLGNFWSSSENSATIAWRRYLNLTNATVFRTSDSKTYGFSVRCLKDDPLPSYLDSGTFESAIRNAGSPNVAYGSTTFNTAVPVGTGLAVSIRGGNTTSPDGNWTAYAPVASGGTASALNGKQYIQYKVEMTGGTATPTFSDITFEIFATTSITLDTMPPTSFSLSSPSSNTWSPTQPSPTFTWGASTGHDKYQLWVDGVLNKDNIASGTTSTTPTSALSEGNHTWTIKALDNAGNVTGASETWNYGYDPTIPGRVTGFTASINDISKVSLSWNAYADTGAPVDNYVVERVKYLEYLAHSMVSDGDWSLGNGYAVFTFDSVTTAFDDDPTAPLQSQVAIETSVKYIYRIKVKDIANAAYSPYQLSSVYGMTQDGKAPDDVTGVAATACDGTAPNCFDTANEGFEIKISWNVSVDVGSGVAKYNVYRAYNNPAEPASFEKIGETAAPGLVLYDNDALHVNPLERLNDFTTYYYRVTAVDASDNANESNLLPMLDPTTNTDSAQTPDVTPPTVPTSATATPMGLDPSGTRQRVNIVWAASSDIKARSTDFGSGVQEYHIARSASENGTYTTVGTVLYGAETSYNNDNLDEFTDFWYKISALDNSGNESVLSEPAQVRTASNSVPTVPTNVSVTSKKGNQDTDQEVGHKVTLSYRGSYSKNCLNGVRCIVKYEVYRATTNWVNISDWINPAKATKIKEENVANLLDDRDTTYTAEDTDLSDATTYYYKVRTLDNTPAVPDGGPFYSGMSVVSVGTLRAGWDITPDVTAPILPLELKVKDIHDDGLNYRRNIVTWKRIETPLRNGSNDFREYRLYRSNDGLSWSQILVGGQNPLFNASKELALANNYYMDLIPIAESNQYYYYYVTAADDAGSSFTYPSPNAGTIINAVSNESKPDIGSQGNIVSVSLNPAIAKPSINTITTGAYTGLKAGIVEVGVSTATINWVTDQNADSLIEFRKKDTSEKFRAIGDREMLTNHVIEIFGLSPNTTYEYRVISRNYLANDATASGSELPALTTTGFNITAGTVIATTSTTEINWVTNLDASSAFVEYQLQRNPGDEPQSGVAGASQESLAASPRNHKVIIKGLRSNRTYVYKIKSISKDGYLSEYPSGEFASFKTKSYDTDQFTLTPASSNVAERNITSTSAQIVWQTSVATTSWVDYGTKSGIYDISSGNNDLNTYHVVVLDGLVPGTKYFYRVRVKDANEVEFTSQEYTFTAVLKPKISDLMISDITAYSVVITWVTNIDTETLINWGKSETYGEKKGSTQKTKNHMLKIENLEDNTEYHYQILARDETGEEVADADKIVRTPLDISGPKITEVKTDMLPLNESDGTASVIISWKTDKPSTTLVQYDSGLIGTNLSKASIEDPSLSNSHTVIVKDLDPATTYRYRITSKDKRGNSTTSNDYNFITPAAEKSILQLILKSLEETFSWVANIGQFFKNIGKKTR